MDGYHKYRKDLDAEGIKRRGAPFTFDVERFRHDILTLRVQITYLYDRTQVRAVFLHSSTA